MKFTFTQKCWNNRFPALFLIIHDFQEISGFFIVRHYSGIELFVKMDEYDSSKILCNSLTFFFFLGGGGVVNFVLIN